MLSFLVVADNPAPLDIKEANFKEYYNLDQVRGKRVDCDVKVKFDACWSTE